MSEMAQVEMGGVASRAAHAGSLHRRLTSFGVLMLTLSCLSPVFSIYGIGPDVLQHAGTGAASMFLVGIGSAMIWALVYAELGSAYPYAGGDYVGVGSILGGGAGFASLAAWAATSGPSVAIEAKTIATYVQFADFAPPMVITFVALLASVLVAILAVRTSAIITGVFLAIEMCAVVALGVAGAWHPVRGLAEVILHPVGVTGAGVLGPISLGALALAGVSASYATVGGNQAIGFGEELQDPHRNMGKVIVQACLIGAFATAVPVILVALSAVDLVAVIQSPAPFSTFVSSVAGPTAANTLSAIVAVAIFNAMIAQIMFSARLFFSLGRDRVFGRHPSAWLGRVNGSSGAPRVATWVVGIFSAVCCFVGDHTLVVFISALTVYTMGLVSLAVLIGRRRGLTGKPGEWRSPLYPLGPVLGIVMTIIFAVADLLDADAGRPSFVFLGSIVLLAVLWHQFVLRRRPGGWTPHTF
jgi:amino acid transporter